MKDLIKEGSRIKFVKDNCYGEVVGISDIEGCLLVAFDDDWEENGAYSIKASELIEIK